MKKLNTEIPSLRPYSGNGTTIYDLLKKSNPAASHDDIIAAADDARVLDFAWELREGMQTYIHPDHFSLTEVQETCIQNAIVLLHRRHPQLRVS